VIHTTTEWQTIGGLELTPDQISALSLSDAFLLRPDIGSSGRWQVTASQFVGSARFGDLEIRVQPKVGVYRLIELLCTTLDRMQWRDEDTMWADSEDLLATVAATFATHAERVVQRGLLQGYHTVDERLLAIRGRIAIGRQVSRNPGLPIPIEVTYDDYTTDVIENQLLAGATRILLRLPGLPALLRSRLRRLEYRFHDVSATPASASPPTVTWSRLNDRYRQAVTIARLVLRGSALDMEGPERHHAPGFLVDMNKVFEDVVGQEIRTALEPHGYTTHLQEEHFLDAERTTRVRPDVIVRSSGTPIAVADIKYKVPESQPPASDLFQAVTYARRFGLDEVTLIYAAPTRTPVLTIGGARVRVTHIDLDAPPDARREAVGDCARDLIST
jgi:5-methylcytosine-specific restriction enzyme subunit McrC